MAVIEVDAMARARKTVPGRFKFEATLIEWRGPAPFVFAPMPAKQAAELKAIANRVSYGWGCIPVEATVGGVVYTSSLFPRDGTYLLPIKVVVRRKTNLTVGDTVTVDMTVQPTRQIKRLAS
ncbi:MAG TPA: DUF1905 domain-containing protein [Rhizomicrobium sp.]|nr:DUF1905 domain-containing protein [Rhizomicrobium sp.]